MVQSNPSQKAGEVGDSNPSTPAFKPHMRLFLFMVIFYVGNSPHTLLELLLLSKNPSMKELESILVLILVLHPKQKIGKWYLFKSILINHRFIKENFKLKKLKKKEESPRISYKHLIVQLVQSILPQKAGESGILKPQLSQCL